MMTDFASFRARIQAELFASMPDHIARRRWSAAQIASGQQQGLRALLASAIEHSPFHARRLRGVDPASFTLADLASLPVMTKSDLMTSFDEVIADRRLTRDIVEQALSVAGTEPVPLFDRYVCLASGGSSGVRGTFVFDQEALVAFIASNIRPLMARLASGDGIPAAGVRIAMVAAGSAVHATGSASALMAGSPITFTPVPVTLPLATIVGQLNALQPDFVFGYPSMLARLAGEQQAGRLVIAPRSVTAISETLLPEYRAAITAGFKAPLVNGYGSTEGLVGSSGPDEEAITFNTDICIVELVDEANRPVPVGTASAKVLVTNLANRAQPLIRYELSDCFTRLPDAPDHGHLRATVEGRGDEILRFAEVDLHPLTVASVLLQQREIRDYQVRQMSRGIDVSIVTDNGTDLDRLRVQLRDALSSAGLIDPDVRVQAVATLARHPETGKLRRFIAADCVDAPLPQAARAN